MRKYLLLSFFFALFVWCSPGLTFIVVVTAGVFVSIDIVRLIIWLTRELADHKRRKRFIALVVRPVATVSRSMILFAVAILAVIFISVSLLYYTASRAPIRAPTCADHLRQISMALLLYAADNAGFFPNSQASPTNNLEFLVSSGYAKNDVVFSCPESKKTTPSKSPAGASHSDYIYIGSGLRDDNNSPTTTPTLVDYPENHRLQAVFNAVYVDGHTESHSIEKWRVVTGLQVTDLPER